MGTMQLRDGETAGRLDAQIGRPIVSGARGMTLRLWIEFAVWMWRRRRYG